VYGTLGAGKSSFIHKQVIEVRDFVFDQEENFRLNWG
jgi:hypothetical protein